MDSDWFIRIKMDLNGITLGLVTDGFRLVYQKKGISGLELPVDSGGFKRIQMRR
jgi:hypothetical protein